jgi:hypothetical protein
MSALIVNANTAFEVTDQRKASALCKFVLTRISIETNCSKKFGKFERIKKMTKERINCELDSAYSETGINI